MIKYDLDAPLNPMPMLTNYVVRGGLLKSALWVIDVGCGGGFHPRWSIFGPHVFEYGFDPQVTEYGGPRKKVYPWALGDYDGQASLQVLECKYGSSIRNDVVDRELDYQPEMLNVTETRSVEMRRLDSLWGKEIPSKIDVLKIDAEGYEREVLGGGRELLRHSGVFLVDVETNFNPNPGRSLHIADIACLLDGEGFRLVSLVNNALPYRVFGQRARDMKIIAYAEPAPTTFQAVFYRERNVNDDVLKHACVLETYGVVDLAYKLCLENGIDNNIASLLVHR